jgi:hypothetical protein
MARTNAEYMRASVCGRRSALIDDESRMST